MKENILISLNSNLCPQSPSSEIGGVSLKEKKYMANRRMFSKEIVGSDQFLDLPVSSRELYFQLGMYSDDDGFVSPKKVIRMVGSSEDDIKVLMTKGFIIPFESGVIVIRHWKENNYIQSDRYKPTIWQNEYELACEDSVYKLDTQRRRDKKSIDKKREEISSNKKPYFNGMEMRHSQNKWWCLPKDGSQWLEFAGKEKEIQWL